MRSAIELETPLAVVAGVVGILLVGLLFFGSEALKMLNVVVTGTVGKLGSDECLSAAATHTQSRIMTSCLEWSGVEQRRACIQRGLVSENFLSVCPVLRTDSRDEWYVSRPRWGRFAVLKRGQ